MYAVHALPETPDMDKKETGRSVWMNNISLTERTSESWNEYCV